MNPVLPTLLCLGLCLPRSTRQQEGALPPPRISALPGPVVGQHSPVTILCQGPPEAATYRFTHEESRQYEDRTGGPESMSPTAWNITEVTPDHAGQYVCSYLVGGQWSPYSAPLHLAVTGLYAKPSLSSLAGSVLAPGETVNLQCSSSLRYEVFVLTKEDGDLTTQNQNSRRRGHGFEAIFPLGPASPALAGTFRCYGALRNNPYLWSHPSDQLRLEVKAAPSQTSWEGRTDPREPGKETEQEDLHSTPGTEAATGPDTEEPGLTTAPPPSPSFLKKHQGLLIGLLVTIFLLLLLLLFLFFIVRRCKGRNNAATGKERWPEANGTMVSEATDPQEVTYTQVTCSGPTQGTAATKKTPHSEYATLALRSHLRGEHLGDFSPGPAAPKKLPSNLSAI